jgi:hypothetical protein
MSHRRFGVIKSVKMNIKKFNNTSAATYIFVAASAFILSHGSAFGQAKSTTPVFDPNIANRTVRCGYVLYSELTLLAPRAAHGAFDDLMFEKFAEAQPEMEAQSALHPDSLAIIAGMLQLSIAQDDPTLVDRDISTLGSAPPGMLNDKQKFELATALYYNWLRSMPPRQNSTIEASQNILSDLYINNHDPVVGLMLADTLTSYFRPASQSFPKYTVAGIVDQLICSVGGPELAWVYRRDEASGWKNDPPGVNGVPEDRRFILLAVIDSRGSMYHEHGETRTVIDGVAKTTLDPGPPDQAEGIRYFDAWHEELFRVLGLHPLKWPGAS